MQSVVSYPDRGPWGNNKYRGNMSGYLVKDIIEQFIHGESDREAHAIRGSHDCIRQGLRF